MRLQEVAEVCKRGMNLKTTKESVGEESRDLLNSGYGKRSFHHFSDGKLGSRKERVWSQTILSNQSLSFPTRPCNKVGLIGQFF